VSTLNDMPAERIVRFSDDQCGQELQEGWLRQTDDQAVRGVDAWKPYDGDWRVALWVAEFLREEPLESEMRRSMTSALTRVVGVHEVIEEDRGQWIAVGSPSGVDLVTAAAAVVDCLSERARLHIESLQPSSPDN
jgi:hypothetical protein